MSAPGGPLRKPWDAVIDEWSQERQACTDNAHIGFNGCPFECCYAIPGHEGR